MTINWPVTLPVVAAIIAAFQAQPLLGPHDQSYAELTEEQRRLSASAVAADERFQAALKRGWDGLRRDLRGLQKT